MKWLKFHKIMAWLFAGVFVLARGFLSAESGDGHAALLCGVLGGMFMCAAAEATAKVMRAEIAAIGKRSDDQ